jgi:adenosylcobinamide kinase/adenosylcobinamide-phosphate guanylyltransferase
MGKITFILGGARSGKSTYAQELAYKGKKPVAFIATCLPCDSEMKTRVKRHRQSRPSEWDTFEESKDIAGVLEKHGNKYKTIVIDCLTLFVSNLMEDKHDEAFITGSVTSMLAGLRKTRAEVIIVSNEVGLGIVPMNKVGREFRDIAGRINQITAKESDRVFFMVSGISRRIK